MAPVAGIMPGLLEIGKIKIGVKGEKITSQKGTEFRPPKKIDHFIITTNEKNEAGDFLLDTDLMDRLKENKRVKLDAKGNIVGIPIRLLYNEIDLNIRTRWVCYNGTKVSWYSDDGITMFTRDGRKLDFDERLVDPKYDGPGKGKISGKMSVIIEGADTFGGCWGFRTASRNTVESILGSLSAIKHATGGRLAFLPLMLTIQPKSTIIPKTGAPTTVHIVSVIFQGSIEQLQQASINMAKDNAQYLIEMKSVEEEARKMIVVGGSGGIGDEEESDIAKEFFPEQARKEIMGQAVEPEPKQVKPEPKQAEPETPEIEPEKTPGKESPNFESVPDEFIPATKEHETELKNPDDPTDQQNWLWLRSGLPEFAEQYKAELQAAPAVVRAKFISKWNRMESTKGTPCPIVIRMMNGPNGLHEEPIIDEAPEKDASPPENKAKDPTEDNPEVPQESPDESGPATQQDLFTIVMHKKNCKITDMKVWNKLIEPYGVDTAKKMTHTQAQQFIKQLEKIKYDPELLPT